MSSKNLTKQRSDIRWKLSYQLILLIATMVAWVAVVALLQHGWMTDVAGRLLARHLDWTPDFQYAVSVVNATAGWTSMCLVAMMGWQVRKLYALMGLSAPSKYEVKAARRSHPISASPVRRPTHRKA